MGDIKPDSLIDIQNQKQWESEISKHSNSHVFQSHAWANTFAITYGHIPSLHILASTPSIIVPISCINRPLSRSICVSMPYSDFAGPLSYEPISENTLKQIPLLMGVNFVDVRLDEPIANENYLSHFSSYRTKLPASCDTFWSSLPNKSVRYCIRKALKDGYSVIEAKQTDLPVFYTLMSLTRKKHGLPTPPFKFYNNLYSNLIAKGNGSLLLAKDPNHQIVAGSLFLFHLLHAYYKYNASDHRQNVGNANHLLLWEGIKKSIERGCSFIDLGRVADSNTGLVKFKRHWQADRIPLYYLRVYASGKVEASVASSSQIKKIMSLLIRKLPPAFSKLLGNVLYKYFS